MPVVDSGTKTTDGTEQTLTTQTVEGFYVLTIDTDAMAAVADKIEVRIKTNVLTAGTERVVVFTPFEGVQPTDDKIKQSIPVKVRFNSTFTIKRVGGTDRAYPWSVDRI